MTEKQARAATLVIPVSQDLLERVPPDQRDYRVDKPDLLDRLVQQGLPESLVSRVRQALQAIKESPDLQVTQVVLAPPVVSERLVKLEPLARRGMPGTLASLVEQVLPEIKEFRDPPVPQVIRELRDQLEQRVYRDPPDSPAPPGCRDRRGRQARRGPKEIRVRRGRKE